MTLLIQNGPSTLLRPAEADRQTDTVSLLGRPQVSPPAGCSSAERTIHFST